MHDFIFCESVKPSPPIILRLPMLPFSVGHEILLLKQQNPLLFDQETFNKLPFERQKFAIIRAALVCYRTWNQNKLPEKNLWLWGWFNRRSNWAVSIAEFRNYRTAGSAFPPVPTQEHFEIASGVEKEERGRELGGSYFARLATFLARGRIFAALGYETPWDVPFGMANHLYLADLEMEGAARIENQREAQVRSEMEDHKRAVAEEIAAARKTWTDCRSDDDRRAAVEKYPRILNLFPEAVEFTPVAAPAQEQEGSCPA